MKISIFGLGYVGAVSLACLVRDGHEVIGVDIDPAKLDLIAAGKTPVVEEGMVELMATVAASGRVAVTRDAHHAVRDSDISLVCVGTPSAANGSQDQGAILRLAAEIGHAIADKRLPHIVVFRSTLVPGTVETVLRPIVENASAKKDGEGFYLCFQPEFLRSFLAFAPMDSSCAKARRFATMTSRRSRSSERTIANRFSACENCSVICRASSSRPRCARPK